MGFHFISISLQRYLGVKVSSCTLRGEDLEKERERERERERAKKSTIIDFVALKPVLLLLLHMLRSRLERLCNQVNKNMKLLSRYHVF